MSFLPDPYKHPYEISPDFSKSVAYFSSEFGIDQTLKIYSGGLGFLAGSHMRSAHDLKQNMVGIGILWSFGYYNQVRGDHREMAVQIRRKQYHFLQDTGLEFEITIHHAPVKVRVYFLPPKTFGTCPMFLLTTDFDGNDEPSRNISRRLYDSDQFCRIAQYMLLGIGGARLLEELGVEPEVYHLNEAHALSAAFHRFKGHGDADKLRQEFVFTTHTPETAGNETHSFHLLRDFSFFSGLPKDTVRDLTGIDDDHFNHTLAALRVSRVANGVSKLHGEVARKMWKDHPNICPITHITNAQNKKYWVDAELEAARVKEDLRDHRRPQARTQGKALPRHRRPDRQASSTPKPSPSSGPAASPPTSAPTSSSRDFERFKKLVGNDRAPRPDHLGRQALPQGLGRHRPLQPPRPRHRPSASPAPPSSSATSSPSPSSSRTAATSGSTTPSSPARPPAPPA